MVIFDKKTSEVRLRFHFHHESSVDVDRNAMNRNVASQLRIGLDARLPQNGTKCACENKRWIISRSITCIGRRRPIGIDAAMMPIPSALGHRCN